MVSSTATSFALLSKTCRDGVPDSVCDALFSEFDIDHDGEISFEEYLSYMLRDTLHRNVSKAIDFVKVGS